MNDGIKGYMARDPKKRAFIRRTKKGKRVKISREAVSKAVAAYLENGGEITKMESTGGECCPFNDHTENESIYLTEGC